MTASGKAISKIDIRLRANTGITMLLLGNPIPGIHEVHQFIITIRGSLVLKLAL